MPFQEYRDSQRAYADIAQVLAQYPGFAPRTDVYSRSMDIRELNHN